MAATFPPSIIRAGAVRLAHRLHAVHRALVIGAACLLLVSTAAGATRPVITERDTGKTFLEKRGHELTLRLSNRYRWTEPRVSGSAIRLIPVDYFVDPGFREWTIRGRATGRARISASGTKEDSRKLFRIVVIVR
jgi:hypothetical protein